MNERFMGERLFGINESLHTVYGQIHDIRLAIASAKMFSFTPLLWVLH